jgi:hypothetical protein
VKQPKFKIARAKEAAPTALAGLLPEDSTEAPRFEIEQDYAEAHERRQISPRKADVVVKMTAGFEADLQRECDKIGESLSEFITKAVRLRTQCLVFGQTPNAAGLHMVKRMAGHGAFQLIDRMFGRNSLEEKICGSHYAALERLAHSVEMRPYELLLMTLITRLSRAKLPLEPNWFLAEAQALVKEWRQPKAKAGGAQ